MAKKKKVVKAKKGKRPIKSRSAKKGGKEKAKKATKAKKGKKVAAKLALPKKPKEKMLGMVDHYFGKIAVAAIKVKAPIKVGDVIHVQGHTTDFVQKVDSIQIEHQSVPLAKKGDDIGIKVKEHVREHDVVYLAAEQAVAPTAQPAAAPQTYGQTKFVQF